MFNESVIYDLSRTLEKEVSKETGLYLVILFLSPFLNNGFTTEYFNRVGQIPDYIDLLQKTYTHSSTRH